MTDAYQGARTSLSQWAALEPSNTSGLLINERNADYDIYAVFFKGSFVNEGPMSTDGLLTHGIQFGPHSRHRERRPLDSTVAVSRGRVGSIWSTTRRSLKNRLL